MMTVVPNRISAALGRLGPFAQLRLGGAGLTLLLTVTDSLSVLSNLGFDGRRFGLDFLAFTVLYMSASLAICQLALTPFIVGRISLSRGLLATAAAVLANASAEAICFWLTVNPDTMNTVTGFGRFFAFGLLATSGPRAVLWLAVMLVVLHQLRRQHELNRLRDLEARVAQARLSRLEAQINPHFLFNALNTVGALINLDRKSDARGATVALGTLLRRNLERDADPVATIADEMEFTETYLKIEALRFPERLRVVWLVDDRFRHVLIPRFSLQTLMENVVKHGVSKTSKLVTTTVEVTGGHASTCCISIRNDCYIPPASPPEGLRDRTGVGIANLNQRAEILFPSVGKLVCGPTSDSCYECKLYVPLIPKSLPNKQEKPE